MRDLSGIAIFMSNDTITISVYEKKALSFLRGTNETRINGKISHYEETYDGTGTKKLLKFTCRIWFI